MIWGNLISLGTNFRCWSSGCETLLHWRQRLSNSIKSGEADCLLFRQIFNSVFIGRISKQKFKFCYSVCFMPQIFVWNGGSFTLVQTLDFEQDVLSVTPFIRSTVLYLVACIDTQTASCLLLQWISGRFQNPQPLPLTGRASQVETINTRAEDILLLVAVEGDLSCSDTSHNINDNNCLFCTFK